jgi:ABC-type phosphate transport system permease subunit
VIGGGAAVLVSYLSMRGALLVGTLALAIIFLGVIYLERAPYERQARKPSPSAPAA